MKSLELKIPPPVAMILWAIAMWGLAKLFPTSFVLSLTTEIAVFLLGLGGLVAVAGVISFRMARTTVDPRTPASASTLVRTGVFRFTRNPMYVGDVLILMAWSAYLQSPLAAVLIPAFAVFLDRFQIQAEERALTDLFGDDYRAYKKSVRRWI